MKIKIIIPCYNEEHRLPLEEYKNYLKASNAHDLVFVNDGSTDGTLVLLHGLKADYPEKVSVIDPGENQGKAEAIRSGVLDVLDKGGIDWIGYMDADLATEPQEFDKLIQKVPNGIDPDLIMGSRIKLHGSSEIERYWYRHYFGRVFATAVSKLLKLEVYDTQCGAKLIHAERAKDLFVESFTSRWLFDVELICRLMGKVGRANMEEKLQEIPVSKWTEKGDSKISLWYTLRVPLELRRIKRRYKEELKKA